MLEYVVRTHERDHLEGVESLLGEYVNGLGDADVRRRQVAAHPRRRRLAVQPAQLHRVARPSTLPMSCARTMQLTDQSPCPNGTDNRRTATTEMDG